MKLLLDENLPKKLKLDFSDFETYSIADMQWNGLQNGVLLQKMMENGFDVLLTFDKNLQHQQNFKKYTLSVFVLVAANNTYLELTKLTPKIINFINENESLPIGTIIIQ